MDAMGGLFSAATKRTNSWHQSGGSNLDGSMRFGNDGSNMDVTVQFNYDQEFQVPSHWTGVGELFVRVLQSSTEYKKVSRNFFQTLNSSSKPKFEAQILEIHRIENKQYYQKYTIHRKHVAEKLGRGIHHQVESTPLWHGTKEEAVNAIASTKFDRGLASVFLYGRGCYFAREVNYSAERYCIENGAGERFIFQVAVVTGEAGVGEEDFKTAPPKPKGGHYDSVVDCLVNPRMYVVFDDCAAYPEYLVKFKLHVL